MAGGDGAFLVAELLERVSEEGSVDEKAAIKGWFKPDVKQTLESGEGKGKRVLLEKVVKFE